MSERPKWDLTSSRYRERLAEVTASRAGGSTGTDAPAIRSDRAAAQLEMTGVHWDAERIELDRIRQVGVERARHRFRAAIPDLIWNAAALEGNTFTLPEVRTLLDGVTVSGHRIEEEQQILALSEGYSMIDDLVGSERFALDKATCHPVHGLIARHEAIESGHFRGEGSVGGGGTVQLSAGGYVDGVPADELPQRWDRLLDFIADLDDPRERALAFNASATRTQYYFDGNKRTARLMMTGMLLAQGYDVVSVPNARRLEFNVALDTLFATDDASSLMSFLASCALPGS